MSKFVLLYDCPIKTCDKIWLYEGLQKYGEVKLVSTGINISYFRLSRKFAKIKAGTILVYILIYIQSIKALLCSNKEDIIVTWAQKQGIVLNNICSFFKIKRKIVSFCWINLPVRKRQFKGIERCLKNENFIPVVNDAKLEEDFKKQFNLSQWYGVYLPDVFDNKDKWMDAKYKIKGRYVFAGGVNNRDWNTLLDVAKETPEIQYIIVTGKNDIEDKQKLKNVTYYEELPSAEYYNLMKKSYLSICPLKENRVSGLINLIKSIQYGIPCIATNLDVTSIYYPKNAKNLLYRRNHKDELKKQIQMVYTMSESQYIKLTKDCQEYMLENFNPERNIQKLMEKLF